MRLIEGIILKTRQPVADYNVFEWGFGDKFFVFQNLFSAIFYT